jgi:prepilin-type N-terminal cleavage/methylation domain-containing protein
MKARQHYKRSADVAHPAKSTLTAAFTLIEMSIVIVIIGLIVGGIIVGDSLIHAANVRAAVRQLEEFDTAINNFKEKYNCLPGDCTDAWAYGFTSYTAVSGSNPTATKTGANAIINGTGLGMIYNSAPGSVGEHEIQNAFWWMQQVGLIAGVIAPGSGTNHFDGATSGILSAVGIGFYSSNELLPAAWSVVYIDPSAYPGNEYFTHAGHYYWVSPLSDTISTALMPVEAYEIDEKIDDGLPRTGKVLASGNRTKDEVYAINDYSPVWSPSDDGPAGATSNYCITNTTPPQYNVQNTSRYIDPSTLQGALCTLTVEANF